MLSCMTKVYLNIQKLKLMHVLCQLWTERGPSISSEVRSCFWQQAIDR